VKRTYKVRCNDEVEAQRRRWTFYETIKISSLLAYNPFTSWLWFYFISYLIIGQVAPLVRVFFEKQLESA
jgi:hypothetical protein